jgi:uncharacterized membrane protein
MSENMITALFYGFTLLILLILQILTPRITRRNILFGVKIPEDKMETEEVKKIIKGFRRETLIIGIPALILIFILVYYLEHIYILNISIFLYMGLLFIVYLRWNKKSKELKEKNGWGHLGKGVVVVDMRFSRDKEKIVTISKKWFLIPIGIIIISTILSLKMYPYLPDKVPTHWNWKGNIDGYMDKSMFVALMMPMTQVLMTIVIYITYYFSMTAKQQINPRNPEDSLKRNIIFRKVWSIYLIVLLVLMEVFFTVLNMLVLGIIRYIAIIDILGGITFGFAIIGSVILSVVVGQGGDRLKIKDNSEVLSVYDIDDDRLWKLGNTIYYNPDDASVFVEKRVGVGWTINAARPLGMAIMILPIIIIILTIIFVK